MAGRFDVADLHGASLLPKGRKTQGLLAYIASLGGRPARRSQLVDLFWSDRAEAQGKASLRQCLHELKTSLGPRADQILKIDRQVVSLKTDLVAYDLWARDGTIRSCVGGPFLQGLDPVAPVFDEWVETRRREIFAEQLALAERELGRATLGDDKTAILDAARMVLQLDPRSETAAREAMRIHAARHQNSQLLQVYRELCRHLEADGFNVGKSTQDLFEELRAGARVGHQSVVVDLDPLQERNVNPTRGIPVVAVPQFAVRGPDCDPALADTLSEDFVARIATMPELHVQVPVNPQAADYVVMGSVSSDGPHLRCNIRINHRASGIVVWSDRRTFDGKGYSGNISNIADEMSTPLVAAIEKNEHTLRDTPRYRPLTAYDHYILAKQLIVAPTSPDYAFHVRELLEHAIKLDPLFEPAYDLLAQNIGTSWYFTQIGVDMTEPRKRVVALVDRLLSINNKNSGAHMMMGWVNLRRRNFLAAERSLETAIELDPYDPIRINAIANGLVFLGRFDEGEAYYELARRRMANNLDFQRTDMGELFYLKRDFEGALSWLEHTEMRGRFRSLLWRTATYAQLGMLAEAQRDLIDLESEFEKRWASPEPYKMFAGIKWYLDFKSMKRDIDKDVLLDGLFKAGVDL